MKYFAVELHSHTEHSDGKFTVDELIENALAYGYAAIALTDHNTFSGHEEIDEKGLHEKIPVIKGIEWTTFYGHMLVLHAKEIVDWRTANPSNIDEHMAAIKKLDGIVGIAHPKMIGSPICTGCRWEFNVEDWQNVDFIEIWNHVKPEENFQSEEAYDFWRGLLKQGYQISPSAGKDWHVQEAADENTAVTYVGIEGDHVTNDRVVEAIRKGHMYTTLGPKLEMSLLKDGKILQMGDTVAKGKGILQLNVLKNEIPSLDRFNFIARTFRVIHMEEVIYEIDVTNTRVEIPVDLSDGYVRTELIGDAKGRENQRLAISTPIYIE